jgi:hypothetical protein
VAARRQPVETEERVRKKSKRHWICTVRAPPDLSGLERGGNAVFTHLSDSDALGFTLACNTSAMRVDLGPARLVSEGPGGLGGRASLGGRAGPALAGGYRVRAQTGGLHRLFLIAFCQT